MLYVNPVVITFTALTLDVDLVFAGLFGLIKNVDHVIPSVASHDEVFDFGSLGLELSTLDVDSGADVGEWFDTVRHL